MQSDEPSASDAASQVAVVALDVPLHSKQTHYPEPFAGWVSGREKRRLGDAFGLSNFGVNLTRLRPGAVSSARHSHTRQDEFVYILQGRPTLWTDAGATALAPGMCAGFRAGNGDAHQLRNGTAEDVWYLEVGDRSPGDQASYPDDDLAVTVSDQGNLFTHKDGRPY
ncbi:cupin domain-containing protein [Paucibacter sp. PLA-PC-4]|uniref:cupin domain-containing protein n=1 Tax=Paucibacter sp. PLA-PC-4 TaxID=2993655 RepID=UPI0022493172|nr:cupin domain-containing protein [Paucibacter sp. PLA-PC-4]MCX2861617.1 cupin domain-containing protein [Paucibacter sp. PLA-PC-4]